MQSCISSAKRHRAFQIRAYSIARVRSGMRNKWEVSVTQCKITKVKPALIHIIFVYSSRARHSQCVFVICEYHDICRRKRQYLSGHFLYLLLQAVCVCTCVFVMMNAVARGVYFYKGARGHKEAPNMSDDEHPSAASRLVARACDIITLLAAI